MALSRRGHEVVIGTRNVADTLGRTDTDAMGNPPFAQWQAEQGDVALVSFADAGSDAEAVVNATAGSGSLAALTAVGADRLAGKVLVDVANPLDFSQGMPPVLSVANTDSLAEQLQRAFPGARVVKTLNTVTAQVMVDPSRVPGEHSMFMAGDDVAASPWSPACSATSAGPPTRSSTSADCARPAAWRCTCRCGSRCGGPSALQISTSR